MKARNVVACLVALHAMVGVARAQLALLDEFDAGLGSLVAATYDGTNGRVWVYESFGANLSSFTPAGDPVGAIPRPGSSANDADLDVATTAFTLNATLVPAGTLLYIDGESGTADIYAVDKSDGTVLASLATAFGNAHVVGGAWHPGRSTLFLVTDHLDTTPNTIAEIDPTTGAVLNSFGPGADFTVNFGDIEVGTVTGNLFLVSSDETFVRELTPTGTLVGDYPLPAGVSSPSGIGIDDDANEAYVASTSGNVYRLGAAPTTTSTSVTTTTTVAPTTTTTLPGACTTVELIDGRKLLLNRGIGLVAKDADISLGRGNGSADDPVVNGGTVRVVSSVVGAFDDTYDLPAASWKYKKKQGTNKGYTLRKAGPIKSIAVLPGKKLALKAKGSGLGHTLGSDPEPVDVVLTIGEHCYCMRFGGDVQFKPDKKWHAKN